MQMNRKMMKKKKNQKTIKLKKILKMRSENTPKFIFTF